jgi:hypothetical protein
MSAFAYSQRYDLPHGYTIEFTLDGLRLECSWSPRMPTGKLARKIHPAYRTARDRFVASLGVPAVVVEI